MGGEKREEEYITVRWVRVNMYHEIKIYEQQISFFRCLWLYSIIDFSHIKFITGVFLEFCFLRFEIQ